MSLTNDAMNLDELTLTIRGKIFNNKEMVDKILPIVIKMTEFADKTIKTLLIMRGKKYTLDGIHYSDYDVKEQQLEMKRKYKIDEMSDEDFIKACSYIYTNFIYTIKKNGITGVKSSGRDFANTFFSKEDRLMPQSTIDKNKRRIDEILTFKKHDIFPIKIDGKVIADYSRKGTPLQYSIVHDVLLKLTSMEEITVKYELDKEHWETTKNKCIEYLPLISRYEGFCGRIRDIEEMKKFDIDNYRRFLNRWRDYVPKENDKRPPKEGMRTYFLKLDKNHVFTDKDRFKFGYCPEFMNMIFSDFADLWREEDILGKQHEKHKKNNKPGYVSIIFEHYHWQKEAIGISSFGRYGTLVPIRLSNSNFVKFELKQENGIFTVYVENLFNIKDKDHAFIICKCPQFSETTKIESVRTEVKKKVKDTPQETQELPVLQEIIEKI